MSRLFAVAMIVVAGLGLQPSLVFAHCDALDGPVVHAARTALEKNDVDVVLRWVTRDQEAGVRAAFSQTVAVRAKGADARALADQWFFETLVRIHRAGEGAPFEGLKPAGHIEPFAAAVDRSLTTGSPDDVVADVTANVRNGVHERFARVRDARARADDSVEAGRQYVAAYVDYLHYVEGLLEANAPTPPEHQQTPVAGHQHSR